LPGESTDRDDRTDDLDPLTTALEHLLSPKLEAEALSAFSGKEREAAEELEAVPADAGSVWE
jgi:hypothetical protein